MPFSTLLDSRFDLALANSLAKVESFNKHLYRPNTYLHKWWARRCGTTFRLILKGLVDEPALADYYSSGGLEGKTVLDPMMGGGTTLHEAIRLGANVIGMDLDPIPVLQARATLSEVPLTVLEQAFSEFYSRLRDSLGDLFETQCPVCSGVAEMQFMLYGLRRSCPCGTVITMDSTILRQERKGSSITICPWCGRIGRNNQCDCLRNGLRPLMVEKGSSVCPSCSEPYQENRDEAYYARYEPVAVMGKCPSHGPFFATPSATDTARLRAAEDQRPSLTPSEEFGVRPGPKSGDLIRRGITSYLDLFSSRQLLFLHHAARALSPMEPLVRLNIALLVSTSLEFNSMLCGYKGGHKNRPGAIRHTFSHHAYSFPYTALENNPLFPAKTSGTLLNLYHSRIRRGRLWASAPSERKHGGSRAKVVHFNGEVDAGLEVKSAKDLSSGTRRFLLFQGSSTSIQLESDSVDYVVTDPPYFDSVQYGDLAAFFRVWLQRLAPGAARWDHNAEDSAVEVPDHSHDGRYTEALALIFGECRRVLKKDCGRMVFTFHHWNPKGWLALTKALKRAGFLLINRYIVHSENPASVHIVNLNALRHDAVLVTAPVECGLSPHWALPQPMSPTDSRGFCEACASALGWMLSADLSEDEMGHVWEGILRAPQEDLFSRIG